MKGNLEKHKPTVYDMWGRIGITEHPGGVNATRKLIELCGIKPNQVVIDIGCGTGYTACLLAKEYAAQVIAVDINLKVFRWATRRILKEGVGDKVTLVGADAQELPFATNAFDAVIAESVLVFCDPRRVASEAFRILKPGVGFGINELTYFKPPPDWLPALFSELTAGMNVQILPEGGWRAVFGEAGFGNLYSGLDKISPWKQLRSHIMVDGVRRYLTGSAQEIIDPTIRAIIFSKDVLKAVIQVPQLLSCLGYGLYIGRKPHH